MPNQDPAPNGQQTGSQPDGSQSPSQEASGQQAGAPLGLDSEITLMLDDGLSRKFKVKDLATAYQTRQEAEALMASARRAMVASEAMKALAQRFESMRPEDRELVSMVVGDPDRVRKMLAAARAPRRPVDDMDDDDPFALPSQRSQDRQPAVDVDRLSGLESQVAQLTKALVERDRRDQAASMRASIEANMDSYSDIYGSLPQKVRERALSQLMMQAASGGDIEKLVADQAALLANVRGGGVPPSPSPSGTPPAGRTDGDPLAPTKAYGRKEVADGSFIRDLVAHFGGAAS